MNNKQYIDLISSEFPIVRSLLPDYLDKWTIPGPDEDYWPGMYNIWGDIVSPKLVEPLLSLSEVVSDSSSGISLSRIFEIVEMMANEDDRDMDNFVMVGVCDRIGDSKDWLARARQYMGPRTRELSDQIERFLGRI
jgi:hypothetical protein